MKARSCSGMAVAIGCLVAWTGLLALTGVSGAQAEGQLDGKALFTEVHKCNMCHAVPTAGIEAKTKSEKMKGSDLGGKVDVELEKLAAYLRKAGDLEGKTHKKEFKGTDEELQAIVDWLGSLEAQK